MTGNKSTKTPRAHVTKLVEYYRTLYSELPTLPDETVGQLMRDYQRWLLSNETVSDTLPSAAREI